MAFLGFLKIKLFWNNGDGSIICVYDIKLYREFDRLSKGSQL